MAKSPKIDKTESRVRLMGISLCLLALFAASAWADGKADAKAERARLRRASARADVPKDVLEQILREAAPGTKVKLASTRGGIITEKGKNYPIVIPALKEVDVKGKKYVVMIVYYAEGDEQRVRMLRGEGELSLPKHKDSLLIASLTPPHAPVVRIIDSNALIGVNYALDIDDFSGTGEPWVMLFGSTLHVEKKTGTQVVVSLLQYFNLPAGKKLFASTPGGRVMLGICTGPWGIPQRRIRFVAAGKGKPKDIEIKTYNPLKKKIETIRIPFENGRYDYKESPWKFPPPRGAIVLKLRIVDAAGKPISYARIKWNRRSVEMFSGGEYDKGGNGLSNGKGEFSIPLDGVYTSIEVKARGYYSTKKTWETTPDSPPISKDWIPVVMEKEHPRVAMIDSDGSTRIDWEEKQVLASYQLGLKLIDGSKISHKALIAKNKAEADIWFVIEQVNPEPRKEAPKPKDEEPDEKRTWRIKIEGLRGWEVAPGPADADEYSHGKKMRVAPKEGYKASLTYGAGKCPKGLYLRHKESERYGKLWELEFEDRPGRFAGRHIWVGFSVQAKSVGNRSLNPIKEK